VGLFNFLTIFDWISPLAETVNDVVYIVSTGEIATPLGIDKNDLPQAKRILTEAGYTVVSITTESWHDEGYLDVPDHQAQAARELLAQYKIRAI